jgi:hypothetical protein
VLGSGASGPVIETHRLELRPVRLEAAGRFWMENTSGSFCWEPRVHTFDDCQALDACGEGGGGESVSGCYKWATLSDTAVAPPWQTNCQCMRTW